MPTFDRMGKVSRAKCGGGEMWVWPTDTYWVVGWRKSDPTGAPRKWQILARHSTESAALADAGSLITV